MKSSLAKLAASRKSNPFLSVDQDGEHLSCLTLEVRVAKGGASLLFNVILFIRNVFKPFRSSTWEALGQGSYAEVKSARRFSAWTSELIVPLLIDEECFERHNCI